MFCELVRVQELISAWAVSEQSTGNADLILYISELLANMKVKDTVVFTEMYEMGLEGTSATALMESWHRTVK